MSRFLLAVSSSVVAVFLICQLYPLKVLELRTLDLFFNLRGSAATPSDITIVGIDDRSLNEIHEPYAFYGKFIADAAKICKERGANVIAIDVLQPRTYVNEDFVKANRKMKDAIRKYDVVCAYRIYPKMQVPTFLESLENAGVVNLTKDIDGVVRRQSLFFEHPAKHKRKSFALKALEKLHKSDFKKDYVLPETDNIIINYAGPPGTFQQISLADVLKRNLKSDEFKNQIVLIGDTSDEGQEFHATPFSDRMPGVEVHANILQTLLQGSHITRASGIVNLSIIIILALACTFLFYNLTPLFGSFGLIILCGLYTTISFVIFTQWGIKLDMVRSLMIVPAIYGAVYSYRLVVEGREKNRIRRIFGRYTSPGVVDKILSQEENPVLTGESRELTVLFSDIENFTVMCEKVQPDVLIGMLNEYLSSMTEIIFKYEGTLDKFIGDGIMTFFGAPLSQENHAKRAVLTALEMIKKTDELATKWNSALPVKFNIRIGVHTGPAIVGDIGSAKRKEYTVMGDNVNIASRLEQLNKDFGTRMIISEATHKFVKDIVMAEFLGEPTVKGKTVPLKIYGIKGLKTEAA